MDEGKKKAKDKCKYGSCKRDPWENDDYCIFHSKDIEGKKKGFYEIFWKEFERQKKADKTFDFKGFVFPDDIVFRKVKFANNVTFSHARFSGEADFYGVEFKNLAEANFHDATFERNADFNFALFERNANFNNARFFGEANFHDARFFGEATFFGATFSGEANFFQATFGVSCKINFNEVTFERKADFGNSEFYEEALFSRATFSGEAYFHHKTCDENAISSMETFSGGVNFNDARFERKTEFDVATFPDIPKVKMDNTYFYDVTGLLEILESNKKTRSIIKRARTEFLSDNIKIILGEKSSARYPIISRQINDDWFLLKYRERHKTMHFIWWIFADCGRSLLRWALWSIFCAVFFAFLYHNIYYLNDMTSFTKANIHETWPSLSFLYYSVVTFTTLGFGDITPKPGWLQFWVMAEVILGYFMLGGLISILANKLARRS